VVGLHERDEETNCLEVSSQHFPALLARPQPYLPQHVVEGLYAVGGGSFGEGGEGYGGDGFDLLLVVLEATWGGGGG